MCVCAVRTCESTSGAADQCCGAKMRACTCADALLAVARPLELAHVAAGIDRAQEYRLKLVHSSVGEEQRRVVQRHLWITDGTKGGLAASGVDGEQLPAESQQQQHCGE